MKHYLLPAIIAVLASGCTTIKEPSHVLLAGANTKVQPVVIKQVIVQPVYRAGGQPSNMAQSMLSKEEYNKLFMSPYTYPYRKNVSADNSATN